MVKYQKYEKKEETFYILITPECADKLRSYMYGTSLPALVRNIVEEQLKDWKNVKKEAVNDIGHKKNYKLQVKFTLAHASRVEKERGRMGKSEFLRYVINLWILQKKSEEEAK
jgi:hypothetical protein